MNNVMIFNKKDAGFKEIMFVTEAIDRGETRLPLRNVKVETVNTATDRYRVILGTDGSRLYMIEDTTGFFDYFEDGLYAIEKRTKSMIILKKNTEVAENNFPNWRFIQKKELKQLSFDIQFDKRQATKSVMYFKLAQDGYALDSDYFYALQIEPLMKWEVFADDHEKDTTLLRFEHETEDFKLVAFIAQLRKD